MKTAKAGIEKSVLALVLGLGLVLAAQAQPADSTGAGRVISSQGTISSSSGTTGTLTAEDMRPAPAPAPVYDANRAWTLSFVGETKCLPNDANYCFKINPDGTILRIGSGESCWGQSTAWPIGSARVSLVGYRAGYDYTDRLQREVSTTYGSFSASATPTQDAYGRYTSWAIGIDVYNGLQAGYVPGRCFERWGYNISV